MEQDELDELDVSLDRELLREELKRRSEESFRRANDPAYLDRERHRLRGRIRTAFIYAALAAALAAAMLLYVCNYTFTTYSVDSTWKQSALGNTSLYAFSGGDLLLGSDSVSFQKNGETQWTTALRTGSFFVVTEGSYFALYDRNGYQVHIGDSSGILSTVKVSRKILGADISGAGVLAVYTESSDAAYISYFDRNGNRLSVEVKTVLDVSGYPMHIAISPDGQKLAVVYYSIANGTGESRLVLYDFQNGRASSSYVVFTKEDYEERDALLIDCDFLDDRHLVAAGAREATFLTYNRPDDQHVETVVFDAKVRSVAFTENGFLTVQEKEGGTRCVVYSGTGKVSTEFRIPSEYTDIVTGPRYILFLNGEKVSLYNTSGRKRYEGALVSAPYSAAAAGSTRFLINTGTELEIITYK